VTAETDQVRARRRHRRELFDGVASRYRDSRRGYPAEIVQFVSDTAGLAPGSTVLEVGCGTGQLTGQLAARGLATTAIDIGPGMIKAAREHLGGSPVAFRTALGWPAAADMTGAAGLFRPPVERSRSQRIALPAATVISVETTRATYLSWPEHIRQEFAAGLRRRLEHCAYVHLTQVTSLAMAQVLAA
jgi:SAM-dependent methyltransferase